MRMKGEKGCNAPRMGASLSPPDTPFPRGMGSGGDTGLLRGLDSPEGRGEREERGMGWREQAEQWSGLACGLCPERSELMLSCHQTFQSPAWEPEEKIREPNTYCFFCLRCQVWWDELAICSPSPDLAGRKPLPSELPLSISCSQHEWERAGLRPPWGLAGPPWAGPLLPAR